MKKNLVKILALAALTVSLGACFTNNGSKSDNSSSKQESSQTSESSEQSSGQSSEQQSSEQQSSEQQSSEYSNEDQSSEEQSSEEQSSEEQSSESSSEELVTEDVSVEELLTIDKSTRQWELLGHKVHVSNLVVQGQYGHTLIGGAAVSEYISGLRGVEIEFEELPAFEGTTLYGADVDFTGIVDDVNGRLVLRQGEITLNSERIDGKYSEGHGLPVYSCPPAYNTRDFWDGYLGRNFSGAMIEGYFQLATLPEVATSDSSSSFQVVFGGENLDAEDPNNYSLITVQVPEGLSDDAITAFNTYFEGKVVGDWIDMCGTLQYDSINNLGQGYVMNDFTCRSNFLAEMDEADKPAIFYSWADVQEALEDVYDEEVVDLNPANDEDKIAAPFSYRIDTSYVNYDPAELFDGDGMLLTDSSESAFVQITANIKYDDVEDCFNAIEARMATLGWESAEGSLDEGGEIFILKDGDDVVKQLTVIPTDNYFTIYYMAPRATIEAEFDNFADAKAEYEARVSKHAGKLAGSAVDFSSALVDANGLFGEINPTSYYVSWEDHTALDGYYGTYGLLAEYYFAFMYTPEDSEEWTLAGLDEAYASALEIAGFKWATMGLFEVSGYFNEESGEFLLVDLDTENNLLLLDVIVLNAKSAKYISYEADAASFEELIGLYQDSANAHIAKLTGVPGTFASSLVSPSALLEGVEAVNYHFNPAGESTLDSYYDKYGLLSGYDLSFAFAEEANLEGLEEAYLAALEAAGFEFASFDLMGFTGYYNSVSHEFVVGFGLDEDDGMFHVAVYLFDDTSAAYVSFPYASEAEFAAAIDAEYAYWNGLSDEYFPLTSATVKSFTLGEKAAVAWSFLDTSEEDFSADTGYTIYFTGTVTYENDLTDEDVALFIAALEAAGFVAATHAVYGEGYFNATTNEFMTVSYEGNELTVGYGLVLGMVAGSVITIADAGE